METIFTHQAFNLFQLSISACKINQANQVLVI